MRTKGSPLPLTGILALQGDFAKHAALLQRLNAPWKEVRTPSDMEGIDALIIPGGESSTMGRLLDRDGLRGLIVSRAEEGMAVFGTCAGAILMAREIEESDQPRLALMDIRVRRNAYGRQIESFEADVAVAALGAIPVHAIFIRAPLMTATGPSVEVLASFEGIPVLVRQERLLACAFHPEITGDARIHEYFLSLP